MVVESQCELLEALQSIAKNSARGYPNKYILETKGEVKRGHKHTILDSKSTKKLAIFIFDMTTLIQA